MGYRFYLGCSLGRSRRSGHGLTTFSATQFFFTILCLLNSYPNLPAPLRQHFGGPTWPDHFSKADYDRAAADGRAAPCHVTQVRVT